MELLRGTDKKQRLIEILIKGSGRMDNSMDKVNYFIATGRIIMVILRKQ